MTTTVVTDQYVTFVVGSEKYAVPVSEVREIIRVSKITRVPLAAEHVEGVMNLRGEVLPIINLRKLLNLPTQDITSSKVMILSYEGRMAGIIVDRTAQVIRASQEDQQDSSTQSRFVSKVIRSGEELYLLLNVEDLFEKQVSSSQTRAAEINRRSTEETKAVSADNIQMITFELAGGIYAFKIEGVQEIIRYVEPIQVPGAPQYIKGLIELRKNVLSIVDLRRLLELPPAEADEFTKVIVLRIQNSLVGVIVDRIRGVLRTERSRLLPPPTVSDQSHKELIGVVHNDNEMIMVLDHTVFLPEQAATLSEVKTDEASEKTSAEEEKQYVIFTICEEEYGVQIEEIREINRLTSLAKVPRAPEYIEGLMNLRGEVVPVINLRKKFNLPTAKENEMSIRVIVSEMAGRKTAFIVDSVVGVESIPTKAITSMPEDIALGESSRFVPQVARIDSRVVLLLDLTKILTEQEKEIVEETVEKSSKTEGQSKKLKRAK